MERLTLPGAELGYLPSFDLGAAPAMLLEELIEATPWRQETIRLWGKLHRQPRLVAWYGDPGCRYRYSSTTLEPLAWTARLGDLRSRVEAASGERFNSVLLNYYRDQNDGMGMHSDDERELGPRPVIASVSLGAERAMVFRSRIDPATAPYRVMLASGSVLVMAGETQTYYKHGITKQRRALAPRLNLTFRRIVLAAAANRPL